ncbi:MAG: hypothetical protein U0547_05625 [Dehalococcoidia bacterium]
MPVRKTIRDFVETATEVLEPAESDVRAVQPEASHAASTSEVPPEEPRLKPAAHIHPDSKEREREHRGY